MSVPCCSSVYGQIILISCVYFMFSPRNDCARNRLIERWISLVVQRHCSAWACNLRYTHIKIPCSRRVKAVWIVWIYCVMHFARFHTLFWRYWFLQLNNKLCAYTVIVSLRFFRSSMQVMHTSIQTKKMYILLSDRVDIELLENK